MTTKTYDRRMAMGEATQHGEMARQKSSGEVMTHIANQLYQHRETFIALHGREQLKEAVKSHKPYFDRICQKHGCTLLQALVMVLKQEGITPGQRLLFGAVVTEIVEPSI